jgi:hypothetical protein
MGSLMGMDLEHPGWWYCLRHHTVEPYDSDCPGKDRLGPYPTREEAEHALETTRKRNEEWDAQN